MEYKPNQLSPLSQPFQPSQLSPVNQPGPGKPYQCPPTDPIMTSPERIVRDFYHPQKVQVIHPIQIVNRHHCVPVYEHVYTCEETDEYCGTHPHPHQGMLRD
jgi:hypothetical protein